MELPRGIWRQKCTQKFVSGRSSEWVASINKHLKRLCDARNYLPEHYKSSVNPTEVEATLLPSRL